MGRGGLYHLEATPAGDAGDRVRAAIEKERFRALAETRNRPGIAV